MTKMLFFLLLFSITKINSQTNTIIHDKICIDSFENLISIHQKDMQILKITPNTDVRYDIPISSTMAPKSIIFDTIVYPEYHAKYITATIESDTTPQDLLISSLWGQPKFFDYRLLDQKPSGYTFDGGINFTHENLVALKKFADKLVLIEKENKSNEETDKNNNKRNVKSKVKEVEPNMYSTTHVSSYYFKDKDIWTSNVDNIMYGAYDLALEYILEDNYVLIRANPLYADKVFPMLEMALTEYQTTSINNLIKIESSNKSRLRTQDITNIKNVISDNLKE